MTEKMNRPEAPEDLRQRAEDQAREVAMLMPENLEALPLEETQKVLHELRVHQIELEMQNEELRRAQEEIEASRARYFDLYDLAPVGYLSVSEQGLVVEANLTFATMLGVARAGGTLLRQPLTRFVLPEDEDIYYLHRKQLFESREPQVCELRMLRKDRGQFWARLEATAVEDVDGATVCRIAVSDITERKQSEDDRTKLQEQFNQAQKMETVGRLAGGVAHDLNNLLTPILGYGDLLLGDLEPCDPRKEPVDQIVRAAERARDLVGQLLAFSRKQIGNFTLIDLNEAVESFVSLLRRTIRADIAIESTAGPASCISGDRGQLEQAIMNLAVNAQDAMPEGGVLSIDTSVIDVDSAYTAGCKDLMPGRYALLTISDTGQGMDAETQTHLFEPFFTTKELGHGTGLGLATVYGVVKQHGGRVAVYSEPGHGATFKIYFPVVDGQACSIDTGRAGVFEQGLGGTENILLVEDNPQVRDLTQAVLERLGYSVLLAEDGPVALAMLEAHDGHKGDGSSVQLVLTDVIMPGMSGRELLAKVSKAYPHVRAMLMSGYDEDVVARQGMLEKGANFIQKPFTVEALARKVREALDA
jgi:two-component system cell cycle sensor histidine kinase/response regulator CckA